jgi:hypothetical protein
MGQEEWGNSDGKRGNFDDQTAAFNQSIAMTQEQGHRGTGAGSTGATGAMAMGQWRCDHCHCDRSCAVCRVWTWGAGVGDVYSVRFIRKS